MNDTSCSNYASDDSCFTVAFDDFTKLLVLLLLQNSKVEQEVRKVNSTLNPMM
jgi:hypothetical protein